MTRPRSQLICPSATPYYHCICRCVRRAFLCGEDELTGKDYSHRKGWVLERLALLTEVFCIELYAYAVMANHYHLVIHVNKNKALALTDSEVISRWSRLFVLPVLVERWLEGELMEGAVGRTATLFSSWSWSEIDVEIGGSLERTSTLLSSIEGEIDVGELTWDIHLDLLYIKTVTML